MAEPTATATSAAACRNCGEALTGRFCARCGQEDVALAVPIRRIVGEFVEDLLNVDSRVWRTLRTLLLRPGLLTAEYQAGRRARYMSPLRVYMLSSLLYVFLMATAPVSLLPAEAVPTPEQVAAAAAERDAAAADSPGGVSRLAELRYRWARASTEPVRFTELWARVWAWTQFALMPLVALLLHASFRRATPWYAHHLVFSLHVHAFVFLVSVAALAIGLALRQQLQAPTAVAVFGIVVLHTALAARRVYGLPWPATAVRLLGVGLLYFFVASAFQIASVVAAIWIGFG